MNCGLPRIDYLLETEERNRNAVMEAYPEFKDKKVVLYAPTFRRNIELRWQGLADIAGKDSDFVLVIKGHPNQRIELDELRIRKAYTPVPSFRRQKCLLHATI